MTADSEGPKHHQASPHAPPSPQPLSESTAAALHKSQRLEEKKRANLKEALAPQMETITLSALPQRRRTRDYSTIISFILCVVLPFIAITVYYFGYASSQYSTEFRFAVRDAQSAVASKSASSIGSQLGVGSSSNALENYMVVQYLTSRDAVDELQSRIDVIQRFSRADIDWFARFNPQLSRERFVSYWNDMIDCSYDQVTGIGVAEVRAFSPHDSFLIANTMLAMAEELINSIATKPQQDAIRFAENDLKRAEDRLKMVAADLTQFRNLEQVIDPSTNAVASNALLAQNLRASLAQLQTELSSLQKQRLDANAPMSQLLRSRIRATREQLAAVEGEIPNNRDGASSLSKIVGQYEQLDLERQFAQEMVKLSMRNLENARATAAAQQIYITAFVRPTLPLSPTYPKRVASIAIATFTCLLFWIVGLLFVRSVREHIS